MGLPIHRADTAAADPAVKPRAAARVARPRIRCVLALLLALAGAVQSARAADPQPYRVELAPTGDDALDATLAATSQLESLRGPAPVGPFGLVVRARTDLDLLHTVLESFGYYRSSVAITIDGRPLADPALAGALARIARGHEVRVAVKFSLGPLYRLGRITIDGQAPPPARIALGLVAGQPAVAAAVLAGGARMRRALEDHGYAFAKVDPPIATLHAGAPLLDVEFRVVAGPRVHIGRIDIVGLQRVRAAFVRSRMLLHTGEPYSPSLIEQARQDLLNVGVFSAVSVQLGTAADAAGGVPVTFDVRERPRHAVSFNAAYSSDLGGSGGVTWADRNVFGNAERLTVSATETNIGGSATTGLGYDVDAKLLKPDFGRRDQSLQFAVGELKQSLQAYDQTALTTGVTLIRRFSPVWSVNVGVTTANETIIQPPLQSGVPPSASGQRRAYTLVATPIGIDYDSTQLASPLDDPLHGMRDSLTVTPTRSIGQSSATFVITQLKLAAYLDLHRFGWTAKGRSVLATRALAGLAQGAGEFSLPPDQRFYGGGTGTIRGWRYQGVGPVFPGTTTPIGGTAIIAGSLEFRQRFGKVFGAAVFVDAGEVSASLKPLPSVLRVGLGAGLRYYTPIGPIRLDVAVPERRYSSTDDTYEIYVGLGQAF